MTRTVFCRKYQKEMEGLDAPPFPGAAGEAIFTHVSKQAWSDWLQHQTRLINEKHLNMMAPETRQYLSEQRERFLSNQAADQAEGYRPEAD
jgi:Fe-S cluster biosynthesis and repair protein YggX